MQKWRVYKNDHGRWVAKNRGHEYDFNTHHLAFRFAEIQAQAHWMKVS